MTKIKIIWMRGGIPYGRNHRTGNKIYSRRFWARMPSSTLLPLDRMDLAGGEDIAE